MTLLDDNVALLNKSLIAIKKWPYARERNQIFAGIIEACAKELDLEIMIMLPPDDKPAICPSPLA